MLLFQTSWEIKFYFQHFIYTGLFSLFGKKIGGGGMGHHGPSPCYGIEQLKSVTPNFVACLVFLETAFTLNILISSSETLSKRYAAILKNSQR